MANANSKRSAPILGPINCNPKPHEWTRLHYEVAAARVIQTSFDTRTGSQLFSEKIASHLEKYGFFAVTMNREMSEILDAKYKKVTSKGYYGYELIEIKDGVLVFVYDLDLTYDAEGFALLRNALIAGMRNG